MFWLYVFLVLSSAVVFYKVGTRVDTGPDGTTAMVIVSIGIAVIQAFLFLVDWWLWNALGFAISGFMALLVMAVWQESHPVQAAGRNKKILHSGSIFTSDKVQAEIAALRKFGESSNAHQSSLNAMHITSPRRRDMAKPAKLSRLVRDEHIDKVTFDYINAKGEYSSRRVLVQMVGGWEFEGIDLEKEDMRTFRYDRVVGDITSLDTGEILDPEGWRDSHQ